MASNPFFESELFNELNDALKHSSRFTATYRIAAGDYAEAKKIARGIAVEQTVECPDELFVNTWIEDTIIGQIEDLKKAKSGLETVIHDIDKTMSERFADAFKMINVEFARIMQIMFSGGKARLELTDEAHPLEGGVEMYLQLPGKKRQPLTLMSGGERALTVIALLISFMAYRPAPFCFVDEIDAALDDANVERYSRMIADYKRKTQFVIISHRKKTMEFADTLQGVTMAEKGVSSLVTVRVGDYIKEEQDGVS